MATLSPMTRAPASAVTTTSLTEFHLFPQLSAELRNRIYGFIDTPYEATHVHAIRGFPGHVLQEKYPSQQPIELSPPTTLFWPSLDHVFPGQTPVAYFTYNLKGGHFLSTTAPQIDPLLHVSNESREFLIHNLKHVRVFGTFFNLDRDILFLDASTAINHAELKIPGIEVFAELLRHPDLIKQIKKIAFHVQDDNNHWVFKCAEKIKGELTSLEEMHMVWSSGLDGYCRGQEIAFPTGQGLFFVTDAEEHLLCDGKARKIAEQLWKSAIPDSSTAGKKIKAEADSKRLSLKAKIKSEDASQNDPDHPRWRKVSRKWVSISTSTDEPAPKKIKGKKVAKNLKFRHVIAHGAAYGLDHGVVSFEEYIKAQNSAGVHSKEPPDAYSSSAESLIYRAPSCNHTVSATPGVNMAEPPVVQSDSFPGASSYSVGSYTHVENPGVDSGGYFGPESRSYESPPAKKQAYSSSSEVMNYQNRQAQVEHKDAGTRRVFTLRVLLQRLKHLANSLRVRNPQSRNLH